MTTPLELVCPAGTPAGLRTAVDAGAHSVYCGFRDETNARNFPGLNFDRAEMREWTRRRTPWVRRVLFYVAMALIPIAITPPSSAP